MPRIQLDMQAQRMLVVDWFSRLAAERGFVFGQRGASREAFTLGDPRTFQVTAHFTDTPPFLTFVASDRNRQDIVDAIVPQAIRRVENGDFGGHVWYSAELHETELKLTFPFSGPFFHRLGSQTRIVGWRRLSADVLLEFVENIPDGWGDKHEIFAPKAVVHVHIAAPGPCEGHWSTRLAHGILETVAAICTFALGRPVVLPQTVFPAQAEMVSELDGRRADARIGTLARKAVGLDIFTPLAIPGGFEFFSRARAALLTFDAGVHQERDAVACILFVVAAECLTTPNARWRHSKLTKRFMDFFEELMPGDLDQIVAHGNFEEIFDIRRGARTAAALRRRLLDRVYDYRSGHLHQGLQPSYERLSAAMDPTDAVRRGLFAEFAEAALLKYLSAPRSSLIGHPGLESQDSSDV